MAGVEHAATESYLASGFSRKLGWGSKAALLIIDVCRAYFVPDSPLSLCGNEVAMRAPEGMKRLVEAAREAGVPVIWTTIEYTSPTMKDAGLFGIKTGSCSIWQKGDTRGLDRYLDGLSPEAGDVVIVKKMPSGFFGTTLQMELTTAGIDTVVHCGVSTSGCVRATALDSMQHGFRPIVVGTACGDRTQEIHNANLFDLNAKYADVVSEEEAIEVLRKGWR